MGKSLAWAAKNPPKESNPSELNVTRAIGAKRKERTA